MSVQLASVKIFLFTLAVSPSNSQCPEVKISKGARQQLLQSQLQFSADLLQNFGELQGEDNVFFSPSSIYNALLLAYFASANQTETSLRETLRFPEETDKSDILGAYFWEKKKQKDRAVSGSGKFMLSSVNRMYISDKEKVKPCVEKTFKTEIVKSDFTKNLSSTITSINKFVADNTNNEITDFLSPDSLNENTNLVLLNAAYFRGLWTYPFSPNDTKESKFKLANGSAVPVTLMSQENMFNHWVDEDLGVEVLEMPYREADISMFILLPLKPSPSAISELLNKTTNESLLEIFTNDNETNHVTVFVPKFMVDRTLDLTPILDLMGVGDLFEDTADLTVLTGEPGLKLDKAIHKAKIVVDEVGTVAAAATAIFANRFAADVFYGDHPFVYFIYDKKANTLLFAGVFSSPET